MAEKIKYPAMGVGSLCSLCGLKSMSSMNGKLCQIMAALDENEQRYPVRVVETRDIALVKPLNLKLMDKGTVFIEDIRIYPIKGCAPISLSVANVEEGGFRYDREYCLMSTLKRQKILNQQASTALLWIKSIPDERGITITAPGMHGSIYVPRLYEEENRVCPKYWNYKDGISGFDQGDVASEWLTKYFILHGHRTEEKIRLILLDPNFERVTHDNVTSKRFIKETKRRSCVRFQNEFQFLVISQESMDGLNAMMRRQETYNPEEDTLRVDRFRPSIVLSSNGHLPPHFEDMLGRLFVAGSIQFYHTKPADRCSVPTINQQTGVRHKRLKPTLMDYRTGKDLNYLWEPNWKDKMFFGSYFINDKGGILHRGSVLKMVEIESEE